MICSNFPELEAIISANDEKHGQQPIEEVTILASGMLFEGNAFNEFLQVIALVEQRTSKIFLVLDHTTTSKNDLQEDLRVLKAIDLKKTSLNISLRHFQFLEKPQEIIGIFTRFFAEMVRGLINNEESIEVEEIFEKKNKDSRIVNKKRAHQEVVDEGCSNSSSDDGEDSQNTIKTTKKKMISSENYLTKVTSSSLVSSLPFIQQRACSELLCIQLTKHCHLKLLSNQIDLQCKFSSTNEQAIIIQLESLIEVIDVFLQSQNTQHIQVFSFNLEIPSLSTFLAKPIVLQLIVSLHSKVTKLQINSQRAYVTLNLPQFDFSSLVFDILIPKQAAFFCYYNSKLNNSFESIMRSARCLSDSQQTFNLNYKYQNNEESTTNNNSIQINEPSILKISNKLYLNLLQCKSYFNQANPVEVDSSLISQVISSWNLTQLSYIDISINATLFSSENVQDAVCRLLKNNSNLEKLKYTGSQKDKISVIFQNLAKKKKLTEIQMNLNEITIPNPPVLPPGTSADDRNQSSIDAAKFFSSMYPWSLKVLLINFAPFEKQPIDNSAHLIIPFLKIFSTFPLLEQNVVIFLSYFSLFQLALCKYSIKQMIFTANNSNKSFISTITLQKADYAVGNQSYSCVQIQYFQ